MTHTWFVVSEATKARSLAYRRISGVGFGAGAARAVTGASVGAAVASAVALGVVAPIWAPPHDASTRALVTRTARTLTRSHPATRTSRPTRGVRWASV